MPMLFIDGAMEMDELVYLIASLACCLHLNHIRIELGERMRMDFVYFSAMRRPNAAQTSMIAAIIFARLGYKREAKPASSACSMAGITLRSSSLVLPPLAAIQMKSSATPWSAEMRSNATVGRLRSGSRDSSLRLPRVHLHGAYYTTLRSMTDRRAEIGGSTKYPLDTLSIICFD